MKVIHAHTEGGGAPYPGYINLAELHGETIADRQVLTVRQQGHHGQKIASIVMSEEMMMELAGDILDYLQKKQTERAGVSK